MEIMAQFSKTEGVKEHPAYLLSHLPLQCDSGRGLDCMQLPEATSNSTGSRDLAMPFHQQPWTVVRWISAAQTLSSFRLH